MLFSFKSFISRSKHEEDFAEKLSKGKVYLIKEKGKDESFTLFKNLTQSAKGLAIVRENPKTIPYKNKNIKYIWLSTRGGEDSVNPSDIEELHEDIILFLSANKNGIVLLQGIDYLIRGTSFSTIMHAMTLLKDEISDKKNIIAVSYNPAIFDKNQHNKIESEFEMIN